MPYITEQFAQSELETLNKMLKAQRQESWSSKMNLNEFLLYKLIGKQEVKGKRATENKSGAVVVEVTDGEKRAVEEAGGLRAVLSNEWRRMVGGIYNDFHELFDKAGEWYNVAQWGDLRRMHMATCGASSYEEYLARHAEWSKALPAYAVELNSVPLGEKVFARVTGIKASKTDASKSYARGYASGRASAERELTKQLLELSDNLVEGIGRLWVRAYPDEARKIIEEDV